MIKDIYSGVMVKHMTYIPTIKKSIKLFGSNPCSIVNTNLYNALRAQYNYQCNMQFCAYCEIKV